MNIPSILKARTSMILRGCSASSMHCESSATSVFDTDTHHQYRPAELQEIRSNAVDVDRLLTIAEMTNKYHFTSTSSWAMSALCEVTECPPQPWRATRAMHRPFVPAWCTAPTLRRIIEVAHLCGHQMLCDHVAEKWVELILVGWANPVHAMAVADEYGLARLKGTSYYETLLLCDDALEYVYEPVDGGERGEPPALSPAQRAGLLSGFFSLVRRWEALRATAPTFTKPDGCTYHAHGCLSTWQAVWKSTTKSDAMVHRRTVDVLGRLGAMADLLDADRDLRCALTPACRRAAMDSVRELLKREEDELACHFRDLTRPEPN